MRRLIPVTLIVLFILSSSASSFDGQRKGFVLGGGVGIGYASSTTPYGISYHYYYYPRPAEAKDTGPGMSWTLLVGDGVAKCDILALEMDGIYFKADKANGNVTMGFLGPVWYHYYKPTGNTLFTLFGVGSTFYKLDRVSLIKHDVGVVLGCGVYLKRGCHAGVSMTTTSGMAGGEEISHHQISAFVSYMAF